MSPIAGTNYSFGSNVKFKPGFQNRDWKNRARDLGNRASHMNTLMLELSMRDLGNRAHVRKLSYKKTIIFIFIRFLKKPL